MALIAGLILGSAEARYQRGALALRRKPARMASTRRTSRSRSSTVCWPGAGAASSRESRAMTSCRGSLAGAGGARIGGDARARAPTAPALIAGMACQDLLWRHAGRGGLVSEVVVRAAADERHVARRELE